MQTNYTIVNSNSDIAKQHTAKIISDYLTRKPDRKAMFTFAVQDMPELKPENAATLRKGSVKFCAIGLEEPENTRANLQLVINGMKNGAIIASSKDLKDVGLFNLFFNEVYAKKNLDTIIHSGSLFLPEPALHAYTRIEKKLRIEKIAPEINFSMRIYMQETLPEHYFNKLSEYYGHTSAVAISTLLTALSEINNPELYFYYNLFSKKITVPEIYYRNITDALIELFLQDAVVGNPKNILAYVKFWLNQTELDYLNSKFQETEEYDTPSKVIEMFPKKDKTVIVNEVIDNYFALVQSGKINPMNQQQIGEHISAEFEIVKDNFKNPEEFVEILQTQILKKKS